VASLYHNIGNIYQEQGKYEEVLQQYKKSLEIEIRVYPRLADSKYNMGVVYTERNEMDMARELHREC